MRPWVSMEAWRTVLPSRNRVGNSAAGRGMYSSMPLNQIFRFREVEGMRYSKSESLMRVLDEWL